MTLPPILKKKIEHDRYEIFLSQIDIHPHLSLHSLSLAGLPGKYTLRRSSTFRLFIRGCSLEWYLRGEGCDQDWAQGETGLWCSHDKVSADPRESSGAEMALSTVWVGRMELDLPGMWEAPQTGCSLGWGKCFQLRPFSEQEGCSALGRIKSTDLKSRCGQLSPVSGRLPSHPKERDDLPVFRTDPPSAQGQSNHTCSLLLPLVFPSH